MARAGKARDYCRFVAVAYGLLAVLGLIPTLNINHTFGLIPIEGNDVWLHALHWEAPHLRVKKNYPYRGWTDGLTTTLREQFPAKRYVGLELEVNQALALRYWPNENPIGKHITMGRQAPSEVVGVAADVKNRGLALDPQLQLYFPFSQLPWGNMNLLVRTATDPHAIVSSVRAQVAAIDPDQPVSSISTMPVSASRPPSRAERQASVRTDRPRGDALSSSSAAGSPAT
jgi:hypothetical protein